MKTLNFGWILLLVAVGCSKNSMQQTPIGTTDEPQYLLFFPDSIEQVYEPAQDPASKVDETVGALIEKFGTTGNGKHQLGFAVMLPVWYLDALLPGRIESIIAAGFQVAAKRNIAVYFSISATYIWATRPDLWNFYDPNMAGYNSANINNVEWVDWAGHPLLTRTGICYRYSMTNGAPARLAPHMCYNSPEILTEVSRFCNIIGGAISQGIKNLQSQGKQDLFAGITISDEPGLDNYAVMTTPAFQPLINLMDEDGTPHATLGYCALTNAGYSASNPPADFGKALVNINSQFISFWARELGRNGIPSSKMYNHIAAGSGAVGSPALAFTNAPVEIAFNDYSRPGWTTYPTGPISDNFNTLYDLLSEHKAIHWGGTESNPNGIGGAQIEPYAYLKMHYDHGATVVVMNSGAAPPLAAALYQSIWDPSAVDAYKRFLQGR